MTGQDIERLAARFAAIVDQAEVVSLVRESAALVGRENALSFAAERLSARMAVMQRVPGVLFLCVHNAGRSQMAAGWLRHLGEGDVAVYSAGSGPVEELNPAAVAAMAEVDIDISGQFPKPWTDDVLGAIDVVVSMGCGDSCPVVPGTRLVEWDIPDPAGEDVEAVRPIRDELERKVRELLAELAPGR